MLCHLHLNSLTQNYNNFNPTIGSSGYDRQWCHEKFCCRNLLIPDSYNNDFVFSIRCGWSSKTSDFRLLALVIMTIGNSCGTFLSVLVLHWLSLYKFLSFVILESFVHYEPFSLNLLMLLNGQCSWQIRRWWIRRRTREKYATEC